MSDTFEAVLGKAVLRAAAALDISEGELTRIVVDESAKRLFVKLYISLVALTGDDNSARSWMISENFVLAGRPFDLIGQPDGLEKVSHYLVSSQEWR